VLIRRALVGAALFSLVFAGPASAADSTVVADDNFFAPSSKTINQGDRVRWLNSTNAADDNDHTSTSNMQMAGFPAWNFNLPNNSAASNYVPFARAGAYAYHCEVHPRTMKASVKVRLKATKLDSNSWTVRMASTNAPSGYVHELQRRKQGTSTWFNVPGSPTANATVRFDAASAGTWQLRARFKKTGGAATGYSPTLNVTTT
jgi:plastocyanin